MATSYSREDIVDLAMLMLGGGASLDDVIAAAANYGVDLESVYYSDPGTTVTVDVPADTGPVDTGPVYSEPAYTQEQYQDAGQFIAQNIDKPEVIAQVAQDLNLSTQDILTAVQTVNQDITKADVENYLTKATSTVDTGPVDTGPVITDLPVSAPSLIDRYSPKQYAEAGEWLLKNIDDPAAIKQKAADLGVKIEELVVAAKTVNPDITVADVTNYINRTPEQTAFTQTQVNEAVLTALQNGMTTAEIKEIAEELKVPTASIENAFVNLVGNQSDADIIKGVSELSKTGSITFENIVDYADENKLPYATVANALKSTFKDTTKEQILDSMVYEKDRQQFSALEKPAIDKDGELVLDAKDRKSVV